MSEKIRIYLADDHQILIDGLIAVLKTNKNFEVVGYSLSGENLVDEVTGKNIDIILMDINMPKKDGIEVLKEFHKNRFPCNVIVFSSFDDLKLIKEVLQLGAKGYLTKQSAGENIIEAINTVYNGEEYYSKSVREKIFLSFTGNTKTESNTYNLITPESITDRELEILKLISLEYSGKEISEALYISVNTVETHRKNLLKKLNVKSTVGLVKFAMKHNLINQ
ncbi:two component LuxR family transcriptional regulator [Flavobacterium enshiense DK69]|uniref:LuxR family transcriptional regulator n=1 Tax=Flavobacterium enshiense DK69 TaxID=1107311 RepID=V6S0S0_9FLAO|nr:response regulator transcription factor [Flavobacterium enshiense]ESU20263.1 two component LuxR family transcriptional regulator [Flavobacterium enshiense DK69]KGO95923.1 LuxR family transcriptional regulator [Flavobacterium enshiense DK69]